MKQEIAKKYIHYLSNGQTERIVDLFSEIGMVYSPIYGARRAVEFYKILGNDTINSELQLKEIFQNTKSGNIALYFKYVWTVKSGKTVVFDVVDIFKFDSENKIIELKIIYDTVLARSSIEQINN